jgi:dUTP pyrophosphatase
VAARARTVIVERLPEFPDLPLPARATPGSAGFDLSAAAPAVLTRAAVTLVRTGLTVRCPAGTFLEVRPRSGLGARGVVMANAPGTIDRDYAGEVRVPLTYLFDGEYRIAAGDRIAQVRLVDDLATRFRAGRVRWTGRRTGGFGSTGR